jgi:hypothetical protein
MTSGTEYRGRIIMSERPALRLVETPTPAGMFPHNQPEELNIKTQGRMPKMSLIGTPAVGVLLAIINGLL